MVSTSTIAAAQYLRISAEHHQYAIANQEAAIQQYALKHGFSVVKTYEDAGRSGLLLRRRLALQRLLADVVSGTCEYKAILVYDVSRWGRFQDVDESAHYEFLCKSAGIPVIYCAEPFANDETVATSILKALKRSMAAEYSRELGAKVYVAQKRLAQQGFRVGGAAGFGLRRVVVSPDGQRKLTLKKGQEKQLQSDRVILVPGPRREVECVREIFQQALRVGCAEIVRDLNSRKVPYMNGKPWNYQSLRKLVSHPKYAGCNVWGRTRQKLGKRHVVTKPGDWAFKHGAFRPVVDPTVFDKVQAAHLKRNALITDDDLIRKLKRLFIREGHLSDRIIANARGGYSKSTYVRHFGSISRAYQLVGCRPSSHHLALCRSYEKTKNLRRTLLELAEKALPTQVERCTLKNHRTALKLNDGTIISMWVASYYETAYWNKPRWTIKPPLHERQMMTLLCLANPDYDGFVRFYLMPNMNLEREYQIKGKDDPWLKRGQRLRSLSDLPAAAQTIKTRTNDPSDASLDIAPTQRKLPDRPLKRKVSVTVSRSRTEKR